MTPTEANERAAGARLQFHIASSREQGIREAAPHSEENLKMFGELRLLRAGGFFAGRPEDIIEQLKAVEKRYPGLPRHPNRRRGAVGQRLSRPA